MERRSTNMKEWFNRTISIMVNPISFEWEIGFFTRTYDPKLLPKKVNRDVFYKKPLLYLEILVLFFEIEWLHFQSTFGTGGDAAPASYVTWIKTNYFTFDFPIYGKIE